MTRPTLLVGTLLWGALLTVPAFSQGSGADTTPPTSISGAVQRVLASMPAEERPRVRSSRSARERLGEVYTVKLEPLPLATLRDFIQRFERAYPDVIVSRLSAARSRTTLR